jgi:hypothetical protein
MPEINMPDGTVKRFSYDAAGMEDYRRTMAALELQKQQAGMNTPQTTPSMQLQQPQQDQMGYMTGMQGQPGSAANAQNDPTTWGLTYDLMNNPNLQASMRYIQSQQIGSVYDPLRGQRQMGPPPPQPMFPQRPVAAPPMQVAEGGPGQGAYGQGAYGEARRAQETQPYQGPLTGERLRSKQGREALETPVHPMQRAAYQLFRG